MSHDVIAPIRVATRAIRWPRSSPPPPRSTSRSGRSRARWVKDDAEHIAGRIEAYAAADPSAPAPAVAA